LHNNNNNFSPVLCDRVLHGDLVHDDVVRGQGRQSLPKVKSDLNPRDLTHIRMDGDHVLFLVVLVVVAIVPKVNDRQSAKNTL
jgi:hypothetical protein